MALSSNIQEIVKLSKTAPVLAIGYPEILFGKSTILKADMSSQELGIINTAKGMEVPAWFYGIVNGGESRQIIIKDIDVLDAESQEKFYELLKYKAISDIELPADCNIIVLAKELKNVSESIKKLCLIYR